MTNVFLQTAKLSNVFSGRASNAIVQVCPAAAFALSVILFAQSSESNRLERQVQGQVLTSSHDPAVQITFGPHFMYAGGQRFALYGVADAEQHFYVQANASGQI